MNNEVFIKALTENDIIEELLNINQQYPSETEHILSISLQKFAKGFSHQKGTIFGFGVNANNDTGSVLKTSQLETIEHIEHMT